MRTYLNISSQYSATLKELDEELRKLCDRIEDRGECIWCFPSVGSLMAAIRLLSKHGVQYDVKVLRQER